MLFDYSIPGREVEIINFLRAIFCARTTQRGGVMIDGHPNVREARGFNATRIFYFIEKDFEIHICKISKKTGLKNLNMILNDRETLQYL